MAVKFRRKSFSRKALRAYLEANPNKKHRCGDAKACVLANFIADTQPFPKGTNKVAVWGTTVSFFPEDREYTDVTVYELPKWCTKVVDRFDRIKGRGNPTSKRALKELASIIG
jgi:hypothetical protein